MSLELATRPRQQGLKGSGAGLSPATRNSLHIRGLAVSEGKDPKTYAEGHRERLRARYRLCGGAVLQDYELLELLLTFGVRSPGRELPGWSRRYDPPFPSSTVWCILGLIWRPVLLGW